MSWNAFQRGTSSIDWCEENYRFSPLIAEFINTISNVLFLIFPPLMMHLFKEYSKKVNPYINVFWILFIFVGLSSAYFHATLSLVGQLLDEISILWMFYVGLCLFLPKNYFPKVVEKDRRKFTYTILTLGVFGTCLSLVYPAINSIVLMIFGAPAMFHMYYQVQRLKNEARLYRLGVRCVSVWGLAVVCWLNDRVLCDVWSNVNDFRYFHGVWHLLIFVASYNLAVLFAYIVVEEDEPDKKPELRYWPKNHIEWGIPYVTFKNYF